MKIVREICVAGACIDVTLKATNRTTGKERNRAKRMRPTSEDVQKVNDRLAAKKLTRDINHNFVPGDWHLVLTYRGEAPTQEQAKKDREKFQRRLLREYRKLGVNGKYIAVTEWENAKKIHHHIICTKISFEVLQKIWEHGAVRPQQLYRPRNYKALAEYLIKETSKTCRLEDSAFKRRYSCSRSIVHPEVKRELVDRRELNKEIKPLKGYYIDQDTVNRYEHRITHLEHLEYMMISLEDKPRHKRWYKGTKVLRHENYNRYLKNTEKQLIWEVEE